MDKERHVTLRKFACTPIIRHRLVRKNYSPDDPTLHDYRRQRRAKTAALEYCYRQLYQRQKGICLVCHQHLENGEETHFHHVIPKKDEGTDDLVHLICHRQVHSNNPPLEVR